MKPSRFIIASMAMAGIVMGASSYASSPDAIIPLPSSFAKAKGEFRIPSGPLKYYSDIPDSIAESLLNGYAQRTAKRGNADILLLKGGKTNCGKKGAYTLETSPGKITLKAETGEGRLYGVSSLVQILDNAIETDSVIDCGKITDAPKFGYRGMHVDVSRHFRGIDFLKRQIDAMVLLKLNKMHLHLTDAAGWRFPSGKYPRLTSHAAWRPQRKWSDWVDNGAKYCDEGTPGAYGGYYTKEQLKDLVKYAATRHIDIIPEIEMPAHSDEVIAAYPELSCSGKGGDLCPGKENTFKFIEEILDEVMEIFPSEYIHIGGDEASRSEWETCKDCRRRMEEEGIGDLAGLQSYLIHRVERYVNSKGRRIIGWDEILDGGLAPGATVMSWRGEDKGIEAMRQGHDVIMTPGEFCYLDYTQDAPFTQPESIGGYMPLEKVYSYIPTQKFPEDVDKSHLLGIQANLWSEFITEDSHAEYMYYPRAFALAEISWSNPPKDYSGFRNRVADLTRLMKKRGYGLFDITEEYGERRESLTPAEHLAKGAKVTYGIPNSPKYPASGETTLTDGIRGGWTYQDKKWQGWESDLDVTVDLGEKKPVRYIATTFMHSPQPWVYLPECVEFYISDNGEDFRKMAELYPDVSGKYNKVMMKEFGAPLSEECRYVRIKAKRNDIPGSWLFLDEIIVN